MPWVFSDDNGNNYQGPDVEPWTLSTVTEHLNRFITQGFRPIPESAYRENSHSLDYGHSTTCNIMDLLEERKSETEGENHDMVFVWDIGEITTATWNYIKQCQLIHREININLFIRLMERIESNAKIDKLDKSEDLMNIEDAFDDDSEAAHKYKVLQQFYDEVSSGIREDGPIINYDLIKRCGMEESALEVYNVAAMHQCVFKERWRETRKSLELVKKRSADRHNRVTNVVICNDGVGNGAAQMLLSGNSDQVPIENIYSMRKASKESIFDRIQSRFGEKCVLVYVTSRPQTVPKSKKAQITTWNINASDSIEHLYHAQCFYLLR